MPITYLLGSIFFANFRKYVKWGSGKKVGVFNQKLGNSQGILIRELGMNLVRLENVW